MNHNNRLHTIGKEAYSLVTQFFEYDRSVRLDAKVYDREENDHSFREKIVFRGVRGGLVPGYIAIPKSMLPPYPCILLVHGLGASKGDWWRDGSDEAHLAKELLSMGISVFALDVQYHGERTHNSCYESAWSMVVEQGRVNCYRDLLVQSTGDCRRAMDYLISRGEIDPYRIGILGRSIGGLIAYILTAIDSRVKVAVACATCPMSDYYITRLGWEASAKDRLAPVAPRNFAPAITNAAFLMLNGKDDPYGTEEGIHQLYELVRSPTKELVFFDSGHKLRPEFVPKAIDWFQRHLMPVPNKAA